MNSTFTIEAALRISAMLPVASMVLALDINVQGQAQGLETKRRGADVIGYQK
jgi:hypothetical protein